MSVPNTTNQADGVYIDDVALTYGRTLDATPFVDNAQTLANWTTEGSWGQASNYIYSLGTTGNDFGNNAWTGTYFDCEGLGYSSCNSTGTYTTIMNARANLAAAATPNTGNPALPLGPENITDVNYNWGTTGLPLGGAQPGLADTFAARWQRVVTLAPGTYNFSTYSDDGVRLWIDDYTGTSLPVGGASAADGGGGGGNARYIINNWTDHGATFDYGSFTVTSTITRTLSLEFYENTGSAEIILNMAGTNYSFTDSPNAYTSCTNNPPTCVQGFLTSNSVYPGNSSLMLYGYFNFSASAAPALNYQRLYDLKANSHFYVEVSTDGGFNWTPISTETIDGPATYLPPNTWDLQPVPLTAYKNLANVMIRFRLDTRANNAANPTGDGVYIAAINVTAP